MPESDIALRELILKTVTERAAEHGGTLTRADLSHLMLPNGLEVRVIDQSRGIWNPKNMDSTLSVVSNPDGPYSDRHVAGGLFHYSYRAGSDEGDNRKLRRAFELELPIILLQRLEPGLFVTHAPAYVVDDLRDQREFLLALDESVGGVWLFAGEAVAVAVAAVAGAVGEPVVDGRLGGIVLAERSQRVSGGVLLQLGAGRILPPPRILGRRGTGEGCEALLGVGLAGDRDDRTVRAGGDPLGGVVGGLTGVRGVAVGGVVPGDRVAGLQLHQAQVDAGLGGDVAEEAAVLVAVVLSLRQLQGHGVAG